MPEYERLYLDADVYLALIKGEPGRVEIARTLLRGGQQGQFRVVASTLLYAEVCGHGEVRAATDQAAVTRRSAPSLSMAPLSGSRSTWWWRERARRLSRTQRLRGADAIHLASAIRARCDVLMTWNKNDFPIGQRVGQVEVREPFLFGQTTIEDELGGAGPGDVETSTGE